MRSTFRSCSSRNSCFAVCAPTTYTQIRGCLRVTLSTTVDTKPAASDSGHARPHLSYRRIVEVLDFLQPLMQFIERYTPALQQSLPVDRRFDASWSPIEEAYANDTLEIGDRVRYDRCDSPSWTPPLDMLPHSTTAERIWRVAQLQLAPNATSQSRTAGHRICLCAYRIFRHSPIAWKRA